VFPCERGAKRPLTRNGHWDATTDPRIIERWWQRWPCANVGVPTGKKSDLVLSSRFKPKYVSSFPLIPAIFIADSSAWATMANDVMCRHRQLVALGGLPFGSSPHGDLIHESSRLRK
jgi:hypothetical protein